MNTNDLIRFMQSQGNPQQFMIQMLESQLGKRNPLFASLLNLAKANDTKGIEQIARNMLKEKGLDFDTEFNKFKQTYHL